MTVKIKAVVAGKKITVNVDSESEELGQSLKDTVCRMLCGQIPWLTELTVTEP